MGDKTGIAWTDATWNPTTGCTRVSAGCDHCYAFQLHDQRHVAWKRGNMPNAAPQYHKPFSQVQLFPERLDLPRHWRKPRRIFVDSMADLFHEDVPFEFIARVFVVMHVARQHTYQILTKRPGRMRAFIAWFRSEEYGGHIRYGSAWPREYQHVWLGVSVEDQQRANERIPVLAETPAAVRFLSCEPLLGPLDLRRYLEHPRGGVRPDWLIVGGESGGPPERALVDRVVLRGLPTQHYPKPEAIRWVRSLRELCLWTGVAFFFKQWGGPLPYSGGHELDGRTWEQFPAQAVPA